MDNYKYDNITIPDNLSETIRMGIAEGEKIYRKRKRNKFLIKISGCVAVAILCFGFLATQPVLASKIPIIKDIFKFLEGDYSYQGDLDAVAEKLEEPSDSLIGGNGQSAEKEILNSEKEGENQTADMKYTKTVDGVTVSLSEVYCSGEAIYMSLLIVGEEDFPETFLNENTGEPMICIKTIEKYPFTEENNPGLGFGYLEGKFLDSKTYAGIYRIDIQDIVGGDEEKKQQMLSMEKLNMDFTIEQIIGYKAVPDEPDFQGKTEADLEAMSDEEWKEFMNQVYDGEWQKFPNNHEHWWYEGPFEFELEMAVDKENLQTVIVDEMNENGAGIYSISKSEFEVVVEEKSSEERLAQGTCMVVLDADGKLLPRGSSQYADTYAINGRDVSKIYVYVCDYMEYMDNLNGYREADNFKEILDEKALYSKVVEFAEKVK